MRALSRTEYTKRRTRQFILLCFIYIGAWSESHCVPDKQARRFFWDIVQVVAAARSHIEIFFRGTQQRSTKGGRAKLFSDSLIGVCVWLCVCVCVNGWHLTDGEESAPTSISPPVTFQRAAIYPHHFINKMDYSLYTAQSTQLLVRRALAQNVLSAGINSTNE
jgi:hypothetical protein